MPWGAKLSHDLNRLNAISDPSVIVDVGANVGQSTLAYKASWPGAAVHSIEPTPESFRLLCENTSRLKRVWCHNIALSSEPGVAEIVRADDSVRNRIATRTDELVTGPDGGIVITTLDEFCTNHQITRISLLKIDTEGHDLQVLRGGTTLLAQHDVDFILAEAGFDKGDWFCSDTEVREYLLALGYNLLGIYEQNPSAPLKLRVSRGLRYANMLFVRNDFRVPGASSE
jgi:FkbM family methyltransferase